MSSTMVVSDKENIPNDNSRINSINDNSYTVNEEEYNGDVIINEHRDDSVEPSHYLVYHCAMSSFRFFMRKLHRMAWRQIIWVAFLILLVSGGNLMQILTMNFWLLSFPASGTPGNYTVFALPGILYSIIFVLIFVVYVALKRPNLRFATHWYGWWILIGVGFCDTINSWMATYAASYTSEVLQALFTNLCPLYAVVMCKYILHDPRRYCNITMVIVFVLTIAGILAATLYGLVVERSANSNKIWVFIFFASIPFRVLMNVWQELYMIVYTTDSAFVDWLLQRHGEKCLNNNNNNTIKLNEEQQKEKQEVIADHTSTHAELYTRELVPAAVTTSTTTTTITTPISIAVTNHREEIDSPLPQSITTRKEGILKVQLQTQEEEQQRKLQQQEEEEYELGGVTKQDNTPFAVALNEEHSHSQLYSPIFSSSEFVEHDGKRIITSSHAFTIRYHQGEDTIVKLMMLVGDTCSQTAFTLMLLPADALPWWGNSKHVNETWGNFVNGMHAVFTIKNNFLFMFLYSLGFVFTYIGSAYLNHYSAALCSMVTQLSSPLTALLLVIVPSWNVQDSQSHMPWYYNVIAIVLLTIAAILYVIWEEVTR